MKNIKFKKLIFISILGLLYNFVFLNLSRAETSTSDSFILESGDFDSGSGSLESDNFQLTNTVGQSFSDSYGQYGMSEFFVGSGAEYIRPSHRFNLKISNLQIDFEDIYHNQVYKKQNRFLIDSYNNAGFSFLAVADHPLRKSNGVEIQPTNCDQGCTVANAGIWQDVNNFGFGYNVSGETKLSDFVDENYYRPFASQSLGQDFNLIAYSDDNEIGQTDLVINYQLIVSGLQESGDYQNNLIFALLPNY